MSGTVCLVSRVPVDPKESDMGWCKDNSLPIGRTPLVRRKRLRAYGAKLALTEGALRLALS